MQIDFKQIKNRILDEYNLLAGQMVNTVSGDRPAAIVATAPAVADTLTASKKVARYANGSIEGRQWTRFMDSDAKTMKFITEWRAQTLPGTSDKHWRGRLYWREHVDGTAINTAWTGTNDGSQDLTEIEDIANDVTPHYTAEETLTLATAGIPTGVFLDFIWARITPVGPDLPLDLDIFGHKIKVQA